MTTNVWADITIKVLADSIDIAETIIYDAAEQMADLYPKQIKIEEINLSEDLL